MLLGELSLQAVRTDAIRVRAHGHVWAWACGCKSATWMLPMRMLQTCFHSLLATVQHANTFQTDVDRFPHLFNETRKTRGSWMRRKVHQPQLLCLEAIVLRVKLGSTVDILSLSTEAICHLFLGCVFISTIQTIFERRAILPAQHIAMGKQRVKQSTKALVNHRWPKSRFFPTHSMPMAAAPACSLQRLARAAN